MKKISDVSLLAVLCLIMASCSMKPADVTGEIKQANILFSQAVEKGDTAALKSMYTADARVFPANSGIIDGADAIGMFWVETLKMGINKVNFETKSAQKFGDLAIEEGDYSLFVGNNQMVDHGKYIVTWKHEDGKWKVFRDIWNGNDAPQSRASANDTVMMILNDIKPDKVAQFEEFNKNFLFPAGTEFAPAVRKTVRVQKPAGQNTDGTFTYTYFMDPCAGVDKYDIFTLLKMKFGEKQAQEYMNMYLDCLKDRKVRTLLATETGW